MKTFFQNWWRTGAAVLGILAITALVELVMGRIFSKCGDLPGIPYQWPQYHRRQIGIHSILFMAFILWISHAVRESVRTRFIRL